MHKSFWKCAKYLRIVYNASQYLLTTLKRDESLKSKALRAFNFNGF